MSIQTERFIIIHLVLRSHSYFIFLYQWRDTNDDRNGRLVIDKEMDQIREKLIKIAREKILKTQVTVKSRANKQKKIRSTSRVIKRETSEVIFFPKVPVGFFGYTRPREARLPTEKEQQMKAKFLDELNELNSKKRDQSKNSIREIHNQHKETTERNNIQE